MVFADATYKFNNLRMPLYLLMIEDGNGQDEIVALIILANEEIETIRRFFEIFKTYNNKNKDTRLFMTDKDMVERKNIKKIFPDVNLAICLFLCVANIQSRYKL